MPVPFGVGTPRPFNARANACRETIPSPCNRSTSSSNRCAVLSAAPHQGRRAAVRAEERTVAPVATQMGATCLGCPECRLCALTDQFALLLRQRRVYPHHQIV